MTETATAAGEMTARTTEVSTEAVETGRHAVDVRANANGLSDAMEDLRHSMIRVVRTSSRDVDRRDERRRPCLIEATIGHDGQSAAASVQDISENGCYAVTTLGCKAGQQMEIAMPRFGKRLRGIVVERIDDGLHIKFAGDRLTAAEADSISLQTTKDLVELTKGDHVAFVKRVADAVASSGNVPPGSLASSHQCRLGRWYDHISDPLTLALPAFQALDEPHHHVHDTGRRALEALAMADMAAANRHVAEMRQHSEQVMHCLDEFARTYPTTISGGAPVMSAAA
jgi:Chemoreceptor zinc-binding domain/PilZ domain